MNAVCQAKLTPNVHRDLCMIAKRYDLGKEGVKHQIVEDVATEDKLLDLAIDKASQVAKYGVDKENLYKIKAEMYRAALDACYHSQLGPAGEHFMGLPKL